MHFSIKIKYILTSKKDLSSVFFGGPGIGAAGVTDTTSAKSVIYEIMIHLVFTLKLFSCYIYILVRLYIPIYPLQCESSTAS